MINLFNCNRINAVLWYNYVVKLLRIKTFNGLACFLVLYV